LKLGASEAEHLMMIVADVQMVAWSFLPLAVPGGFDLAALEASALAASEEVLAVEGASGEASALAVVEVVVRVVHRASAVALEPFALAVLQAYDPEVDPVVQAQTDPAAPGHTVPAEVDIVLAVLEGAGLGRTAFVAVEGTDPVG
jgi:hypothetical protein